MSEEKIKLHPIQENILLILYVNKRATMRFLKQELNLSSTSLVHYHVQKLREKGLIKPSKLPMKEPKDLKSSLWKLYCDIKTNPDLTFDEWWKDFNDTLTTK